MEEWIKYEKRAIAMYPYDSKVDNHLRIIRGDILQIFSRNNDWVRAKCLTTSCLGICPITYLQIIDENNSYQLLIFETKTLLSHIFSKVLLPLRPFHPKDSKLLKVLKILLDNISGKSINYPNLARYIDEIRLLLGIPSVSRTKDGSIMRAHDLSFSFLLPASLDIKPPISSVFPSTISLTCKFRLTSNIDLRLCPRLYSLSKGECISSPCDYVQLSNSLMFQTFCFSNIENTWIKDICLVIHLFSFDLLQSSSLSYYLGSTAEMISTDVHLIRPGSEISFELSIFCPISGDYDPLIYQSIIFHSYEKLRHVDSFSNSMISIECQELIGPINTKNEKAPLLKHLNNMGPGYECNSYFIRVLHLNNKFKQKKSRVLIKLIDIKSKKFVSSFLNTYDSNEYVSITQKGRNEYDMDEYCEIDLNSHTDISSLYFVCLIDNPKKSKKSGVIMGYSYFKLTNADGTIKEQNNLSLPLYRYSKPDISLDDLCGIIEDESQSPSNGSITITSFLMSTKETSIPLIKQILSIPEDSYNEETEFIFNQIETLNVTVSRIFQHRLLIKLFGLMLSSNDDMARASFHAFIRYVKFIDTDRGEISKFYFDEFINGFDTSKPFLSELYPLMLKYLIESYPKNYSMIDDDTIENVKDCSRSLYYVLSIITSSLSQAKKSKAFIDEECFKLTVVDIFERIMIMLSTSNPALLISKSFVYRTFPLLCGVLDSALSIVESSRLVESFMDLVSQDNNITAKHRIKLYRHIVSTNFFSNIQVQQFLLKKVISNLQSELTKDMTIFQSDILPALVTIFFLLMKSSSNFSDSLYIYIDFFPRILSNFDNYPFFVSLLYFADIKMVKKAILNQKDKMAIFSNIISNLRKIILSDPSPDIFFMSCDAFVSVVSLSRFPEFDFIHTQLAEMLQMISEFYSDFLRGYSTINSFDAELYSNVYGLDLSPVAALLPALIKSAPSDVRFNPAVFLPLFHFYLSQNNANTRESIAEGFFLVIEIEWSGKKVFTRCENAILHAMDSLNSPKNMDELIDLFTASKKHFKENQDLPEICVFFDRITQLASFLFDLSRYPNQPQFEDERSTAIMSVLSSCRSANDYSLYPQFNSKLYELHVNLGNSVEAAECLLDCANVFAWSDRNLVAESHGFPVQEKRTRKISLYEKSYELFIEAQFYERAYDTLIEMRKFFENSVHDYVYMAGLSKKMSHCVELVCNPERSIPNRFYGVKFYGHAFSEYYRDQTFIYRRGGFFFSDQVMRELKEKFPKAQVFPKPPTDDDLIQHPMYIYVFNVKPLDKVNCHPYNPSFKYRILPNCSISSFYSETPFRVKLQGNFGEFAEWHRSIIHYKTAMPLQGCTRRAKVIETKPKQILFPIECSIIDTNSKSLELLQKASYYWRCLQFGYSYNESAVSSFTMLLNGIVNAAVNGGLIIFVKLFLEGPLKDEETNLTHANDLRKAIMDQLSILNFAISIHEKVINEAMKGLHEIILSNFQKSIYEIEPFIGEVCFIKETSVGIIP